MLMMSMEDKLSSPIDVCRRKAYLKKINGSEREVGDGFSNDKTSDLWGANSWAQIPNTDIPPKCPKGNSSQWKK